ncbi:MAG: cache domain-containing protein [Xanthobacteraceae bacterium]
MLRVFLAIFFGLALMMPSARAAEFGTRDEAVAMVKRVQEKFKKDGPDATFKAVTEKVAEFHDRDLYPFIYDLNGVCIAHGADATLVGKNLINVKDDNGKLLIQELVAVAKGPGSGWVDFRWPNPITKQIQDKSSYVELLGKTYLVGVGIYK